MDRRNSVPTIGTRVQANVKPSKSKRIKELEQIGELHSVTFTFLVYIWDPISIYIYFD